MKAHSYQFHIGDWLASTMHMDAEAEGVYLRLINAIYASGGGIPSDESSLRNIARYRGRRWSKIWAQIGDKFQVENGLIVQHRCNKMLQDMKKRSQQQSAKALKRWETADAAAEPQQCLSINHKPIEDNTNVLSPNNMSPVPKKYTEDFERFWSEFGKNGASKSETFKKWKTAIKKEQPHVIIEAIPAYLDYLQRTNTPKAHATTWLNQERWTVDHGSLQPSGRQSAHDALGRAWAAIASSDSQ